LPTETANERTFVVSDYPDLASFKAVYSRAYAASLRNRFVLEVVGQPTPKQEAVIQQVAAARDSDTKRGERSLINGGEIKVRGDSCQLKRHFKTSCMRQIIGWAEKLASQDHERFIWIKNWKTAKRGRNGDGGTYSQTSVRRCQWALEACGIFTPATRVRGGATRTGWIVAKHDDVSVMGDGRCRLMAIPRFAISPRQHGERLDHYLQSLNVENRGTLDWTKGDVDVENRGTLKGTLDWTPRNSLRNSGSVAKELSPDCNHLGQKELEGRVEKTVWANPVNPVISNPVIPVGGNNSQVPDNGNSNNVTLFASHDSDSEHPNADFDLDPPDSFPPFKTVGIERVVDKISAGKFDPAYLARYEYPEKLQECCEQAAEWISHDADRRRDPAAVMGLAMEYMRETHGLDVPKGWVPVMKALRADAKERSGKRQPSSKPDGFAYTGSGAALIAAAHDVGFDPSTF
jgi:hypothetical protein